MYKSQPQKLTIVNYINIPNNVLDEMRLMLNFNMDNDFIVFENKTGIPDKEIMTAASEDNLVNEVVDDNDEENSYSESESSAHDLSETPTPQLLPQGSESPTAAGVEEDVLPVLHLTNVMVLSLVANPVLTEAEMILWISRKFPQYYKLADMLWQDQVILFFFINFDRI